MREAALFFAYGVLGLIGLCLVVEFAARFKRWERQWRAFWRNL